MKTMPTSKTATLLVSCPDAPGLVARFSRFLFENGGNIIHSDQHTDFEAGLFLTRLEWQLDGFELSQEEIAPALSCVMPLGATWRLAFAHQKKQMAIWVSKQEHCLEDLLFRHRTGELPADITFVASNHADLAPIAAREGIAFHHIPVTKETRGEAEAQALALVKAHAVDLVVLAKYMQILSPAFVAAAPTTLNIHHSFLPAFAGASPYHRAHERGVKIIGATAHYVTSELDAGPIIEQHVARVSHRDSVSDMIREGRDLERIVLARAVRLHLLDRVLVYGNRTVVFD